MQNDKNVCEYDYNNVEMNRMIDNERMAEYENCEWVCRCKRIFNTEEAIVDEANNISCPACGEIVMCDEFRIEEGE